MGRIGAYRSHHTILTIYNMTQVRYDPLLYTLRRSVGRPAATEYKQAPVTSKHA